MTYHRPTDDFSGIDLACTVTLALNLSNNISHLDLTRHQILTSITKHTSALKGETVQTVIVRTTDGRHAMPSGAVLRAKSWQFIRQRTHYRCLQHTAIASKNPFEREWFTSCAKNCARAGRNEFLPSMCNWWSAVHIPHRSWLRKQTMDDELCPGNEAGRQTVFSLNSKL